MLLLDVEIGADLPLIADEPLDASLASALMRRSPCCDVAVLGALRRVAPFFCKAPPFAQPRARAAEPSPIQTP